jgi:dihydroneopterin aldolase
VRHTIFITDMPLRAIIGVRPRERTRAQELTLSVELDVKLGAAAWRDELEHTVDYSALQAKIAALVEGSSFKLIETLARRVAGLCLADPRVEAATVELRKPRALKGRGLAGVRIVMDRREDPKE